MLLWHYEGVKTQSAKEHPMEIGPQLCQTMQTLLTTTTEATAAGL
jgi:hypothetical protein